MKKLGSILGTIAIACIAMAAGTFAILFVAAWSLGTMFVLTIALFMFFGDGEPSGLLLGSTAAIGAIIGAMIGIGMILIDPEKARRWGDR
jgi:hypothetical protein